MGELQKLCKYDLIPKISEYISPQLLLLLIQFHLSFAAESESLYQVKSLLEAKYKLLQNTLMIDYRKSVYLELHDLDQDETEPGYYEAREKAINEYSNARDMASKILEIIKNPLVVKNIHAEENSNIALLHETSKEFEIGMLDSLYKYAKVSYDVGSFVNTSEILYHLRMFTTNRDLILSCMWGKLACEILTGRTETALKDFGTLREYIDQVQMSSQNEALMQRTWILHSSLFLLFDRSNMCEGIIELFTQQQYFNTIRINCTWLLRYLVIAVIVSKKLRNYAKDLANIIQNDGITVDDPFLLFFKCICMDYDFKEAQKQLEICSKLIAYDYFACSCATEFIENSNLHIIEVYCKLHHRINIPELCNMINVSVEQGEVLIAEFIHNSRMDALIDSNANTITWSTQKRSVSQNLTEATKSLALKVTSFSSSLWGKDRDSLGKIKSHA